MGLRERITQNSLMQFRAKGILLRGVKDLCDKNKPLKFIKWLLSGKTVLYATDQDYGMNGSEVVNFFNLPAATISAPHKIIKKQIVRRIF